MMGFSVSRKVNAIDKRTAHIFRKLGVSMTENHRPKTQHKVNIPPTSLIPYIGAFPPHKEMNPSCH